MKNRVLSNLQEKSKDRHDVLKKKLAKIIDEKLKFYSTHKLESNEQDKHRS